MSLLFKCSGVVEASQRIKTRFSLFNLKVVFQNQAIGLVRRGSFSFLYRARMFFPHTSKLTFDVGAFNDFAISDFIVGGEHYNDKLINYSFGDNPLVRAFVEQNGYKTHYQKGGLKIGHCNVFSAGVLCLGHVSIGTGNLIGAGSLLCKDIENYGVYLGRPAERHSDRISPYSEFLKIRWDRISYGSMVKIASENIDDPKIIRSLESDYLSDIYLVVRYKGKEYPNFDLEILGVEFRNRFLELTKMPAEFKEYFYSFGDENGEVKIDESIQERMVLFIVKNR